MKPLICSLLILPLLNLSSLQADSTKNLDKVLEDAIYLETTTPQVHLSGYVDAGYIYNFTGTAAPQSSYGTDTNAQGEFNLNAVKLVLEKALSEENSFQAGFRVDLMLGEDAGALGANTAAAGSSDTFYLQQAHVLIRLPLGNGLDLQVGKFGSILGYEADERPANLNITQGFNASLDPGPSVGILASYPLNEQISLIGGLINGNGQDSNVGLDNEGDGYALTGGLSLTHPSAKAETQLTYHYAPWGDSGFAQVEDESLLGLNWWGNWSPLCCNDKLLLAFNASAWFANDFNTPGAGGNDDSSSFYTAALYAKYQFNSLFSLAGRTEYAHNDDNNLLALPGRSIGFSDDVFSWTTTAGFNLTEELLFRLEYRADLGTSVISDANGLSGDTAHRASAQVVYTF
ncbi:MAG: outer membrane beta-barrel protein [Blastochloris sp.]|nr:outer membrane beta-barrel protein [Blastochloris sp.]